MSSDTDDSSSDTNKLNDTCPFCSSLIDSHNPSSYGLCYVCSDDDNDVFCSSCLTTCSMCGDAGCPGCGSVNSCENCDTTLCQECMGDGGCSECNRVWFCKDCLEDGRCPDCCGEEISTVTVPKISGDDQLAFPAHTDDWKSVELARDNEHC